MFRKRFLVIFTTFISLLWVLTLGLGIKPTLASEFRTDDPKVAEDEVIKDDLYVFGDQVEVEGVIEGDLIVAGGIVDVSGEIEGDVYISGGQITVNGVVGKSLFIAGGTMQFNGTVERNVYAAGGQITFGQETVIGEDLLVAGGMLSLDGTVGDDLRVSGGQIDVDAVILDDAFISGEEIDIDEDNVSGDLRFGMDEEDVKEMVDDVKDDVKPVEKRVGRFARGTVWFRIFSSLVFSIGMYLVGVLFIYLAPVKTVSIVNKVSSSWKDLLFSFLLGLGIVFLGPLLVALVAASVVGLPLSLLMIIFWMFALVFSSLFVDMALGRTLLQLTGTQDKKLYLSLFVGRVIHMFLRFIPCFGLMYLLLTTSTAVGAMIRMKYDKVQSAKSNSKDNKSEKSKKSTKKSKKSKNKK